METARISDEGVNENALHYYVDGVINGNVPIGIPTRVL
jgi:hypothetical protein